MFTTKMTNYRYETLLYRFKLFSLCAASAGNSRVPNRRAVLEDRPYNCDVEMQWAGTPDLFSCNLFM